MEESAKDECESEGRSEAVVMPSINGQRQGETAIFTCLLVVTDGCRRRQAGLLELLFTSTLFTRVAVVQPTTTAIIQILISLATDRVEGDISNECLICTGGIATTCLTATSERSIGHLDHFLVTFPFLA